MDRVCAARLSKRLERIPGKAGNMTEQIQGTFEPGERNAGGFLRDAKMNYRVRPNDVRVPLDLCRKLALRGGETLTGAARAQKKGARRNGKVLSDVKLINDLAIDDFRDRAPFDELTAINPTTAIRFETPGGPLPMRVIDLMTPIGLGQRGLIAAPPRTGKTMLLQQMAHGIATNHPDVYMMVLLIDERPEEVTEMRRTVHGEVIASSNDQDVASHVRIARLMIEKAKRHVECGEDVVILLDSLTRLGRAFNAFTRGRGRTMSGGLDVGALAEPKAIFGAARNVEHGGSLTIIASALIDTGSRMDEVIFNEFKGTGNMEIMLCRNLANKRVWPAIDLSESGTRREELLLTPEAVKVATYIRRTLVPRGDVRAMEMLLEALGNHPDNATFIKAVMPKI
jgi:transcription termination factor Rho